MVSARAGFLADYGTDVNVGVTLRGHGNPIWGTIVLSLLVVPYVVMAAALTHVAAKKVAELLGTGRVLSALLWYIVSLPALLAADVALHIRYFFTVPMEGRIYHYLNLRRLAELGEALPQLTLQAYIGLRLWNPGHR